MFPAIADGMPPVGLNCNPLFEQRTRIGNTLVPNGSACHVIYRMHIKHAKNGVLGIRLATYKLERVDLC